MREELEKILKGDAGMAGGIISLATVCLEMLTRLEKVEQDRDRMASKLERIGEIMDE